MTNIKFANGISVSLLDVSGVFVGVGAVTAANIPLRDPSRPASVDIRTPDGFQFSDWRIQNSSVSDEHASLTLKPSVKGGGLMEWMLHEVRPRINTSDWTAAPTPADGTSLQLVIKAITGAFGLSSAVGFSYKYHYNSDIYPIYKIMDRATWEIGASSIGNSFWLRNAFAPSIKEFTSIDDSYSVEWFQPTASNSSIFQFLTWQTTLEGFTLTFHELGALVTWSPNVSHIRSLFEKPAGSDAIFHWHEHCGDLENEFSTAPIEVIWIPGSFDDVGKWNLYQTVREHVANTLHADIGLVRDRIAPYGVMEEWNVPNLEKYRTSGLPKLLDAGIKTIFLPNEFENNMNTFGVSNMCCTIDYKVAETVGEDNLRAFCQAVLDGGAKVEMWGNTALSTLVPITANRDGSRQRIDFLPVEDSIYEVLKRSADPYVRNPAGAIEADHYTPVFAQLNLRDETIRDYWMKQWTYAYESIGIRGMFLDSSSNMTSDKFHWIENAKAAAGSGGTVDQTHLLGKPRHSVPHQSKILSQYRAHLEVIAEMQKVGYFYCGEDIGVFGTHRSGPDIAHRINNLPMWSDGIAVFDVKIIDRLGADPNVVFFQGLAYRMMWFVYWVPQHDTLSFNMFGKPGDRHTPTDWHISLLRAYSEVDGDMATRRILPGFAGVLYEDPNSTKYVLWSFKAFELSLPEDTLVRDVLDGTEIRTSSQSVSPLKIYHLTTSGEGIRIDI